MTQHVCSTYRRKTPTIRLVNEVLGNIISASMHQCQHTDSVDRPEQILLINMLLGREIMMKNRIRSAVNQSWCTATNTRHSKHTHYLHICSLLFWSLIRFSLQHPQRSRVKSSVIPHDETRAFNSFNLSFDSILTWCFNERLFPGFTSCCGVARFIQLNYLDRKFKNQEKKMEVRVKTIDCKKKYFNKKITFKLFITTRIRRSIIQPLI